MMRAAQIVGMGMLALMLVNWTARGSAGSQPIADQLQNDTAHGDGTASAATQNGPTQGSSGEMIDEIAVRIDTDVITESEVRELAAFQHLVDGSSKPREELIRELADQWIVRNEADTTHFPSPAEAEVDSAYGALVKQLGGPEEFQRRRIEAGLSEPAIRRQVAAQLYLSRFIDFRFRPAAQVDDAAIHKYYDEEFAPALKAKGETVPQLDSVSDEIREVLVQRGINNRATQWLDDTRSTLEIDVLSQDAPTSRGAER